jgi:hypothetical protein
MHLYPSPKYFIIVAHFEGDSTINSVVSVLTGNILHLLPFFTALLFFLIDGINGIDGIID